MIENIFHLSSPVMWRGRVPLDLLGDMISAIRFDWAV